MTKTKSIHFKYNNEQKVSLKRTPQGYVAAKKLNS